MMMMIIETVTKSVFQCMVGIAAYYFVLVVSYGFSNIIICIIRIVRDHYIESDELRAYIASNASTSNDTNPTVERDYFLLLRVRNDNVKLVRRIRPRTYVQSIASAKQEEVCTICLEVHPKLHSIETVCGHVFGACCFEQWIVHDPEIQDVSCPNCKQTVHSLTIYRYDQRYPVKSTKKSPTPSSPQT